VRHPFQRFLADAPEHIRPRGEDVTRLEGFSDAVFGFAVTLLVVSLNVPRDYAGLMRLFAGLPSFAVTFLVLTAIWRAHYRFFRRYGLEDRRTVILNMVLLFMVVAFIYPLKFVFNVFFAWIPGAEPVHVTTSQGNHLFVIYAMGFAVVYLTLAAMYLHAASAADRLELSERERAATRLHALANGIVGGVACLAAAVAVTVPEGDHRSLLAGMTFVLIWPLTRLAQRRFDHQGATVEGADPPQPTPGATP
jgi:uncharacterized membrane protein